MAPSVLHPVPRHTILSVVLAAAQIVFAVAVASRLGVLSAFDQVIFSTSDSRGYLSLAEWIWRQDDGVNTRMFLLRPFVYPTFLGFRVFVGDYGIALLQLFLNAFSTALVFLSARRMARSSIIAMVATCLLVTNLTFGLIAFHALTETLAIFLLSVHLFFLVRLLSTKERSVWDRFGAGFSISLAVCTKPAVLIYWLFLAVVALWSGWRAIRRDDEHRDDGPGTIRRSVAKIGFLLILASPIFVQLALTRVLTGNAVISVAGRIAIEGRIFPAVYGTATSGTFLVHGDERAKRAEAAYPTVRDKVRYLVHNPVATLKVLKTTIWDKNWRTQSSFTRHPPSVVDDRTPARRLTRISGAVNWVFSWIHLAFLPLWVFSLAVIAGRESDRSLLVLLAALTYSLLLVSGLSFSQGDRLILPAMPVWIVLYSALFSRMWRWICASISQ